MRVILIIAGAVDNIIEADSIERAQAAYPACTALADTGAAAIGDLWDGTAFTRPPAAPAVPVPLSRLDFLSRIPAARRIAIRAAAATDPIIADAMALLDAAEVVHLDHADTLNLSGYLVAVGLITADERAAILAP